MHKTADRFRNAVDITFLSGIVFALILADKIVPLLIAVGVLPIPFLLQSRKGQPLAVSPAMLLWPAGIYFAYSLFVYFFFTGLGPNEVRPVNPSLELYAVAIAMLAVGVVRGLQVQQLSHKFQSVVPWALLISFAVLSAYMFLGIREGCRIRAEAAWPFIPALLFATLSFLSLVGWQGLPASARNLRLLLLSFSVVVSVSYTGSRGIAVAEFATLLIFLGLNLNRKLRGSIPGWQSLMSATVFGMLLCGLVGFVTGCGPTERLGSIFKTVTILTARNQKAAPAVSYSPKISNASVASTTPTGNAPPPVSPNAVAPLPKTVDQKIMATDVSIGLRIEMWKVSVKSIRDAPLFGHGSLYLQHLIAERFDMSYQHNHNQYLSWLVTGGFLALGLGLWFLSIPWLISAKLGAADRITITLAVSVFWGIAMVFDSFLNLKFYLHFYCLLVGLLYAFVNDSLRSDLYGVLKI